MQGTRRTAALIGTAWLAVVAVSVWARNQSAPGVPVSMVVTVEPRRGKTVPSIEQEDIAVREGNDKRPVTALMPLEGQHADMQLLLLLEDSAASSMNTEIDTLKQFVNSLPSTTEVAVGYMRNGLTGFTSNFTADHAAAANSIRVVMGPGGADISPYDSLSDAIKKWPEKRAERREIIMISSGIEGLGGGYTSDNPYVNKGIEDAQKAGVIVYTIYTPAAGHYGHSFWLTNWGQNFLSQLSEETGGESYFLGFGPVVSFQPYLNEILERQRHQFLLTFTARPERKSGLQPVKVRIKEKDADVAAADRVYVPASL
ncbi:MAG: hypothetical protein JOY62_11785 [Acidobacteriaceae bacterium]|nr:hypothetical protein [Acidobacteriaceae bacterium]